MLRKALLIFTVLVLNGCAYFSKDKPSPAVEESSNALFQLPQAVDLEKAARLNVELGLGYLRQHAVPRAKSKLNRAKKLAPHLPEVHYSYGIFHEQVGEIDQAKTDYLKAISLNPKGGIEQNHYGAFLCRQKQYREAEKAFLKAIDDPEYTQTARSLENAGLCVLKIPDELGAIQYFERALRYDQNRKEALVELAILKFKEGKYKEASIYYRKFEKEHSPTRRSLLLGIGLAKLEKNEAKQEKLRQLLVAEFPHSKLSHSFT